MVIGPKWVAITDAHGRRRLDDPGDFVRMEVGRALSRGVRVIPVLVEDARMPRAAELPEELQALTRRQYHELSDSRWEYDVGKLIETIEGPDRDTGRVNRRVIVATGAGAALLVGASAVAWQLWPDDDPSEARTSALHHRTATRLRPRTNPARRRPRRPSPLPPELLPTCCFPPSPIT